MDRKEGIAILCSMLENEHLHRQELEKRVAILERVLQAVSEKLNVAEFVSTIADKIYLEQELYPADENLMNTPEMWVQVKNIWENALKNTS